MQRVDVDGVPVFWRQGPEPLTATLLFRVGRRDETFLQGDITHLVEHLVMRAKGRTHLDCNATVDLSTTSFTATGRPEAVQEFLRSVCRSIRDLPVDSIEVEKSVLQREEGWAAHPLECAALLARYGARDLGLAGLDEPALRGLTVEQVREWLARYFVAENAALALTGTPPEGLSLELPAGKRNERPAVVHRPINLPAWTEGPDGVAVTFLATYSQALMAGLRIALVRMVDELRDVRGDTYEVDFLVGSVDPSDDMVHVTFYADPDERRAPSVATEILETLERLARQGPTPDELQHDTAGAVEAFGDPRTVEGSVRAAAGAYLVGRPHESDDDILEQQRALTPAAVASALSPLGRTALVVVPEDVEYARPRLPQGAAQLRRGGRRSGVQAEAIRELRSTWCQTAPRGRRCLDRPSRRRHTRTALWSDVQAVGSNRDGYHHGPVAGRRVRADPSWRLAGWGRDRPGAQGQSACGGVLHR